MLRRIGGLYALLATLGISISACSAGDSAGIQEASDSQTAADDDLPPVFLEQGWDAATRAAFYQTTQGSRMLRYDWFINLEQAGTQQRFSAASNMRRLGFLVDNESASNPDRLPVGFAKDEHPTRGASVGITCAACHTGQIEFRGTRVRIDGGQSHGDIEALQIALLASLEATLSDSEKFVRFANAILGKQAPDTDRAALRAEIERTRDWWRARIARSRGASPHGPTRTDAFSIIGNEVVCDLLSVPSNCVPANAPTQFPFLWGTPDFEWVQYNSSVHSPLGRNVGEATGVFAETRLAADGTLDSTVNARNLHALENSIKSLRAPVWPEHIFGAIDRALADKGAVLYGAKCASCHTQDPQPRTAPNRFGVTFAKTDFSTPLSALGTDPTAAMSFATRRADPGPWRPIAQANGLIGPDGKASAAALLSVSGTLIIQKFFAMNGLTDLQKLDFLGFRESLTPTVAQITTYKARPLNGVAFTPPYLHNGSVASMYELLLPPAQRKTEFFVGSKEFDPVALGFSTERESNSVLFDTRAVGNSNAGHVYGTDLSHEDRLALIEFIKTL